MNKIHKFLRTRSPFGAPLLAIMIFFGISQGIQAQVANYAFTATSGTYTPITGGTVLAATTTAASAQVDDTNYNQTIPFSFSFNGVAYTAITVNSNGQVNFGTFAANTGASPPISTAPVAGGYVGVIAGLGRDLIQRSATPLGEIRVETVGSAPNREVVVQFTAFGEFPETGTAAPFSALDTYNFQIRLQETTNRVTVVYGNFTVASVVSTPPSTTVAAVEVGLRGATNTDFNNVSIAATGSWAAPVTTGNTNASKAELTSTVKPASGQSYSWVPVICTGIPASATTISSVANACSGTAFNLSVSASNPGNTFQWQSSPLPATPATYTNIVGATGSSYAATQTTGTAYRCIISCVPTSTTVTSTGLTVNMAATIDCYCAPAHLLGVNNPCISNVTIGGINNSTTTCALPLYTIFPSNITTSLAQGATVPLTVTVDAASTNAIVSAWVDFNANGAYDATEWFQVFTTGVTGTVSVVVPATATLGLTKMRVRTRFAPNANGATDACTAMGSGEAEDYYVTINPAGCTTVGITPAAGTQNFTQNVAITPIVFGTATGSPAGPYIYAIVGGTLPAGLTFNAGTNTISGTPTTLGSGSFTVRATSPSPGACTGTAIYNFNVNVPCVAYAITPAAGPVSFVAGIAITPITLGGPSGGAPYTFTVSAGALPAGLTLVAGVISGTPTAGAGTGSFTISALSSSNCSSTAVYTFTITCPTITVTPPAGAVSFVVGTAITTIALSATPAGTYTYAQTGTLPAGLVFSAVAKTITGTPTAAGTGSFTITATAGTCPAGSATYTWTVTCPTVTVTPPAGAVSFVVGTAITTIALSATPVGTYTYAQTGTLPTGLVFSAVAQTITGTPTTAGTGSFTITATAGTCPAGSAIYTWTVTCPTVTITPATGTALALTAGTATTTTLGVGALTGAVYTVSAGMLPAGVTLTPAGVVAGTPTTVATSGSFTITATIGTACIGTAVYPFTVVCPAITVLPAAGARAYTVDTAVNATFTATGAGTTYSYAVTAGTLPAGLVLSATGVLTGIPTADGTGAFTVTATGTGVGFTTCTKANAYTFTTAKNPTTAIDNTLSSKVSVSPNPSKSEFNVDFGGLVLGKAVVRVYDAQGKQVFTSNVTTNTTVISLGNLANGIYLMEVETAKGRILKRLAKQ